MTNTQPWVAAAAMLTLGVLAMAVAGRNILADIEHADATGAAGNLLALERGPLAAVGAVVFLAGVGLLGYAAIRGRTRPARTEA